MNRRFYKVWIIFIWAPLILSHGFARTRESPPPNILLITLDTTRADHLPCYGYPVNTMPYICSLARKGILFRHVLTPVPLTLPAHVSLFTGLWVHKHKVLDNGFFKVSDSLPTLPLLLKKRSYHTRAYISSYVLDRVTGLARGFDVYDDNIRQGSRSYFDFRERAASQTIRTIFHDKPESWKQPWFVWVHFYDPHDPYVPPDPFTSFANPYDGELAFVDSAVRELIEYLISKDIFAPGRDWLIIVGDHGEDLGDYGELRHGLLLTPSVLHVPLLIVPPQYLKRALAKYENEPIAIIDIFPTLLQALQIEFPSIDGQSLLQASNDHQRTFYLATFMPYFSFRWSPLVGLYTPPYIFLYGGKSELFLWKNSGKKWKKTKIPEKEKRLKHILQNLWKSSFKSSISRIHEKDYERLERLRSLGYVSLSFRKIPENPFDLPYPPNKAHIYRTLLESKHLMKKGKWEKARLIFVKLLKEDPENTLILNNLATVYENLGEYKKAQEVLERVVTLIPHMDYPYYQLGSYFVRRGHIQKALPLLKKAIAINPRYADAYLEIFKIYFLQKNTSEIKKLLDQAWANRVYDPELLLYRSIFKRTDGDFTSARTSIEIARELSPQDIRIALEWVRVECFDEHSKQCEQHAREAFYQLRDIGDFWYIVGRWYFQKGRKENARYCFEQALRMKFIREAYRTRTQKLLAMLQSFPSRIPSFLK